MQKEKNKTLKEGKIRFVLIKPLNNGEPLSMYDELETKSKSQMKNVNAGILKLNGLKLDFLQYLGSLFQTKKRYNAAQMTKSLESLASVAGWPHCIAQIDNQQIKHFGDFIVRTIEMLLIHQRQLKIKVRDISAALFLE